MSTHISLHPDSDKHGEWKMDHIQDKQWPYLTITAGKNRITLFHDTLTVEEVNVLAESMSAATSLMREWNWGRDNEVVTP